MERLIEEISFNANGQHPMTDVEIDDKYVENAFKDKDTVLIGDLSEYEIAPRISQMKEFCSEFIK